MEVDPLKISVCEKIREHYLKTGSCSKLLHPLIYIFLDSFLKSGIEVFYNFVTEYPSDRWTIFSDFHLDRKDKSKRNYSITLVFSPYFPYGELTEPIYNYLEKISPGEFKNLKKNSPYFDSFKNFLIKFPIFSISLICKKDEFKYPFALHSDIRDNHEQIQKALDISKEQQLNDNTLKIVNCLINELSGKPHKSIKILNLWTVGQFTGILVAILKDLLFLSKKIKLIKLGYLPDRDAIYEICEGAIHQLILNIQHSCPLSSTDTEFLCSPSTSQSEEIFGKFIAIADIITATLADYDMEKNSLSPKAFPIIEDVLTVQSKNLVYRIKKTLITSFPFQAVRICINRKTENNI